ncbi:PiggyBac transposable element-derived protein 4 [Plakobranchus ocellatus]|uniref:PiggyBac transposable element-derived protein 4 n=1 Tax=Plakobranchus ocellatus TaxID=259542 RepID=A0AAV4D8H3_9GAST|nr:PiggyBac transposable element-derived protein 4 [Plakobranchus ocellatus]
MALHPNGLLIKRLHNLSLVDGNVFVHAAFGFDMYQLSKLLMHVCALMTKQQGLCGGQEMCLPLFKSSWTFSTQILAKYFVSPQTSLLMSNWLFSGAGAYSFFFFQFLPSKPDKEGIKIFWACDATTNHPILSLLYLGKEVTSARPAERNMSVATSIVQLSGQWPQHHMQQTESGCVNGKVKTDYDWDYQKEQDLSSSGLPTQKAIPLGESKMVSIHEATFLAYQSKECIAAQYNVLAARFLH